MTTNKGQFVAEDQLLEIVAKSIREVVHWMNYLDRDDFEAWYSERRIDFESVLPPSLDYLDEKWKLFSLSKASWLLSLDERNLARVVASATNHAREILRKYCPRCGMKNPTDVEYHLEGNVPHCKKCFDEETMGLSYLDDDDITIRVGTE